MKAAVYTKYGAPDVVQIKDIPKPQPKKNQVLIRVHATSVNSGDMRARSLDMPSGFGLIGRLVFGIFKPRNQVLGVELAGVIESIGTDVTQFQTGDKVFADTGAGFGAHAEYRALPQGGAIALMPECLGFEQAAVLSFGGVTALQFLRDKGGIQAGDKVLINGASGAVGLAAVQLAHYFGAEVTAVCSQRNHDLVRGLGAKHVIDYNVQDFGENGQNYDLIMDTVGTAPWSRSKSSLTKTGRLLLVHGTLGDMLKAGFVSRRKGKKLVPGVALGNAKDLKILAGLVESGDYSPMINRTFPLDQIVAAHAYVDTGRKRGSVAIIV
jgi:NADPH:quinone reductase-like Zn-dependent oxidoreductase